MDPYSTHLFCATDSIRHLALCTRKTRSDLSSLPSHWHLIIDPLIKVPQAELLLLPLSSQTDPLFLHQLVHRRHSPLVWIPGTVTVTVSASSVRNSNIHQEFCIPVSTVIMCTKHLTKSSVVKSVE